jgi:hypothetical protein
VKKLSIVLGAVVALAVLGGVAWALWTASTIIQTSLQVGAKPGLNISAVLTNDDELNQATTWDVGDTGPDPSGPSPAATRYTVDKGSCVAVKTNSTTASLSLTSSYGGYWCATMIGVGNPAGAAPITITGITAKTTALANCPTMVSVDLNADTTLDVEACAAKLNTDMTANLPIIPTTWAAGASGNAVVSLHVLDTATPSVTSPFDITLVQTEG